MKDIDHLKAYLATKYVGDRVEVTVKRGKKKLKLEVDLETPVRHHPSIIK
jgi:S1-C subfamily serine protease